jgi:hypothetical protein
MPTNTREYDVLFSDQRKYRRFSFESHIVWNINDNIFQNLLQNFEKAPGFTFKI